MSKKLIFSIFFLLVGIFAFGTTFSFATNNDNNSIVNDATNGARNIVNNAENKVEGAVKNMGDTMKDSANKTGDNMNNAGYAITGNDNNNNRDNNTTPGTVTNDTSNYTANRTNTPTTRAAGTDTGNTFLGMNSTTWTWVILAIAAVAIVGLVWYYSSQVTNTRRYDDGE